MRPCLKDLFGEIPVTVPEIDAWLRAVPKLDPHSPRAACYVRDWRVPEKVRDAKRRGDFESLVMRAPEALHWSKR